MAITQPQTEVSVGIGSPTENALVLGSEITVTSSASATTTTNSTVGADAITPYTTSLTGSVIGTPAGLNSVA